MTSALSLMGFGTMEPSNKDPPVPVEALKESVKIAIATGYRHFDTAELYQSKSFVSQAISESGVDREQLFITSKLSGLPSGDYQLVKARTEQLLKDLGLNYVNLLLIHWPGPRELDLQGPPEAIGENASFADFQAQIASAWQNMIQLRADGLTKAIGVSNFYRQHIDELLKHIDQSQNLPFANEIYIDLVHQEQDYVQYLQDKSIHVIAYRPVAFVGIYGLLEHLPEKLQPLIDAVGASSYQQLILAWLMKRGIHVIPSSNNPNNIRENFQASQLVEKIDLSNFLEFDGDEMVDMYGGCDEYAAAFKNVC